MKEIITPTVKKVHISQIMVGDAVLIEGSMETVGKNHISKNQFFGDQYKGYCYHETGGMLDVVVFPRWYKGKLLNPKKE